MYSCIVIIVKYRELSTISELRAGDDAAFKRLVDTYGQRVFNTALGFVQSREAAEDIAQDTFIEIYCSIHKFNEQSSLGTWIYKVAVNKCLDHIRYYKRQKRSGFLVSIFGGVDDKFMYDTGNFHHPGVATEQREYAHALYTAIETLNAQQKTAFILAYVEDMPQKEVADIMEINIKALESLLQRAKANLRKKLGDIYDTRRK